MNWGVKRLRNFKKNAELSKLDSQGIDPKFLYFHNRNDSLNHFKFFEIIARRKMLGRFQTPEFNLYLTSLQMTFLPMTHGIKFMPIQLIEIKYLILY